MLYGFIIIIIIIIIIHITGIFKVA